MKDAVRMRDKIYDVQDAAFTENFGLYVCIHRLVRYKLPSPPTSLFHKYYDKGEEY